jgi:hypothetical protein
MEQNSTALPRDLVADFHNNPIGRRVVLPDGSLAIVRRFSDVDEGRVFRVQGIHRNGRFRRIESASCWFRDDELRMVYYSASINSEWRA